MSAELEAQIRAAWEAKAYEQAATLALEGYGGELMSYLVALLRDAADADDVFAAMCESLWKSLPAFRWESSLRTYAYTLARNSFNRHTRGSYKRRRVDLSSSIDEIVARERSRTATYLRTETRDKVARIRAALDPDDQTLLILRVNRQLPWNDIARIMAGDEESLDDALVLKRAQALRKRFERLKKELRDKAAIDTATP